MSWTNALGQIKVAHFDKLRSGPGEKQTCNTRMHKTVEIMYNSVLK